MLTIPVVRQIVKKRRASVIRPSPSRPPIFFAGMKLYTLFPLFDKKLKIFFHPAPVRIRPKMAKKSRNGAACQKCIKKFAGEEGEQTILLFRLHKRQGAGLERTGDAGFVGGLQMNAGGIVGAG